VNITHLGMNQKGQDLSIDFMIALKLERVNSQQAVEKLSFYEINFVY